YAHVFRALQRAHEVSQLTVDLKGDRVQPVRPVERDPQHPLVLRGLERRVLVQLHQSLHQLMTAPPSTLIPCPVIPPAPSPASIRTTRATSRGSISLRWGLKRARLSSASSIVRPVFCASR